MKKFLLVFLFCLPVKAGIYIGFSFGFPYLIPPPVTYYPPPLVIYTSTPPPITIPPPVIIQPRLYPPVILYAPRYHFRSHHWR